MSYDTVKHIKRTDVGEIIKFLQNLPKNQCVKIEGLEIHCDECILGNNENTNKVKTYPN
jgi:hypothetical protein